MILHYVHEKQTIDKVVFLLAGKYVHFEKHSVWFHPGVIKVRVDIKVLCNLEKKICAFISISTCHHL